MHARSAYLRTAVALALLAAGIGCAAAAEEEAKSFVPPGLPAGLDWEFNLNAGAGVFGFANSLYTNPKPDQPSGDLSDNWMEGFIKPALGATFTMDNSSQLYGKASVVGERTYRTPPPLVGGDAASFDIEDLYIGWRSGTSIAGGENVLDVKIGRAPFKIGNQLLIGDGGAEGGSRGGYWSGARKAFEMAGIATFHSGMHKIDVFYLDKNELPESESKSKVWGANYELSLGEATTLGATYMTFSADPAVRAERDGLDVYNLRAYTAPIPSMPALSFELEYAKEDNGNLLDSEAYNLKVAYQLDTKWQPKISYRYAYFQGDDPNTAKNEAFDGLFTGFNDWGDWWQGEIAGEYFVSNSNLISHQLRVHTKPSEAISSGLIFYDFILDNPASAGVTSDKVATELDWYMDWSINGNFSVSFLAAVAEPGDAVKESSGRSDTFYYGMIYGSYSF